MANTKTGWQPLSVRTSAGQQAKTKYEALHPGVPPWLQQSLLVWAADYFILGTFGTHTNYNASALQELERALRSPLDWSRGLDSVFETMTAKMLADEDFFLNVVDFVLSRTTFRGPIGEGQVERLREILTEGGSAWKVVVLQGVTQLERRVDPTITAAAERVIVESGRPGEYLARAWHEVYGRDPDPGSAYRHAVSAVEAAARPIISPKDELATLGKMIGQLRANPDQWTVNLPTPVTFDRVQAVRAMMELLWKGQADRHGDADKTKPISVAPAEAEAAVHLAVTLVQWFTSRVIVQA